jgi:Flp pilus assembly protein CpaB
LGDDDKIRELRRMIMMLWILLAVIITSVVGLGGCKKNEPTPPEKMELIKEKAEKTAEEAQPVVSTDILPEHSKIDAEIPQEPVTSIVVESEIPPQLDKIREFLPPGMQLYTIKQSNAEVVAEEMLAPGCSVDVLVENPRKSSAENREDEPVFNTLLKKVKAVYVTGEYNEPIQLDEEGNIPTSPTYYWKELIVTLLVDAKQAGQLDLALQQGNIKLVPYPLEQTLNNTTGAKSVQIDDTD